MKITDKEYTRKLRGLAKLKRKVETTSRRYGKWIYKCKYDSLFRRVVRMAEEQATGWE